MTQFDAKQARLQDIISSLDATFLTNGKYAIRPKGQLGTCGWYPYAWTVYYIFAQTQEAAIKKVAIWMLCREEDKSTA